MDTASGTSILRAFERARRRMDQNQQLPETEESAGFLVRGPKGKQWGYQVVVKIVRFTEGGTK